MGLLIFDYPKEQSMEISEKVKKGALSGEYIFFGNSAWRSEAPEKSVIFQRSESLALSKKIS